MQEIEKLKESASFIKEKIGGETPLLAIVLGSGLGDLADELKDKIVINYSEIPYFPISTVPGHKGRLVYGVLEGKKIICMQGRFHYYEGWSMNEVVYPIRTFYLMGIKDLFLTNAAGCVNVNWKAGDLMLIEDHIKLIGDNPCRGENLDELGPRFFDMSKVYNPTLLENAKKAAAKINLNIKEGIYMMFTGPSFETKAEVRFARIAGADAVGMSTVPEAIVASHMGMRTLGVSCLTNMASGILNQQLNHEEVIETGNRVKGTFSSLVRETIKTWPKQE